jgi:hypothetical protein
MAKKILKFRKRPRQKRKLARELIEVLLAEGEGDYRNRPQSKVIPFPRASRFYRRVLEPQQSCRQPAAPPNYLFVPLGTYRAHNEDHAMRGRH